MTDVSTGVTKLSYKLIAATPTLGYSFTKLHLHGLAYTCAAYTYTRLQDCPAYTCADEVTPTRDYDGDEVTLTVCL